MRRLISALTVLLLTLGVSTATAALPTDGVLGAPSAGTGGGGGGTPVTVIGSLPSCGATLSGRLQSVTDGNDASDCTTGGGTSSNVCVCDSSATAWVIVGDGTAAPGGGDAVLIDGGAVADASGVDFIQGTTGIDIAFDTGASPDTATFSLDFTEVTGTTTFGAGASQTWVWNAGATDPQVVFGSDSIAITNAATFTVGGNAILDASDVLGALANVTETGTEGDALIYSGGSWIDDASPAFVGSDITALNATQLTSGTVPVARVGAAHIDAITEIAAALKAGADTTLLTGTAGSTGHCAQWNADGDLITTGAACGGTGVWSQGTGVVYPTTGTDDVVIGGTTCAGADVCIQDTGATVFNEQGADVDFRVESDTDTHALWVDAGTPKLGITIPLVVTGKATITGDADEIQMLVTANATQTSDVFVVEQSGGTDVFVVDNSGNVTVLATLTADTIQAADRTVEPGNRWQLNDNDTAFTNDPTCANSGSAGKLSWIDVDEGSTDNWQICDGTSILFDIPDTGTDIMADTQIMVGQTTGGTALYVTVSGDVTLANTGAVTIQANAVEESMLKVVDSPSDEECFTYESTTGDFEWQACAAGAGDVSAVGAGCADGECLTDGKQTTGTVMAVWEGTTVNANQITLAMPADPGGAYTLTFPENTGTFLTTGATVTVAQGGTGAATLTDHGILLGSGTSAVTPTAAPTDGQLLIGDTGADPVLATLTDGTGITITEGAGSITIASTLGTAVDTSEFTGTLAHEKGGVEADVSAYSGLVGINGGSTSEVDTESELETHLGDLDVVTVTTDDITSANLATLLSNETGTGVAVFGTNPTLTGLTATGDVNMGGADTELCNGTVAQLPASPQTGSVCIVTDGNSDTDCTGGLSSDVHACVYNGAAWIVLGDGGAGSVSFSALTGATNTTAAMVVGTGASLAASGSGTITATATIAEGVDYTMVDNTNTLAGNPAMDADEAFWGGGATTGGILFEGDTADTNETLINVTDPTADRAITFPDATGTVVLHDATQTLTNKTLGSSTSLGAHLDVGAYCLFDGAEEILCPDGTSGDDTWLKINTGVGEVALEASGPTNAAMTVRQKGTGNLNFCNSGEASCQIVFETTAATDPKMEIDGAGGLIKVEDAQFQGDGVNGHVLADRWINAANPTVDALNEFAYDSDDFNIRVYDGSNDRAINTLYDKDFMIFEPDQVNDLMCIFKADAALYPFGITLTQLAIWLPADAAYAMVFEEWAGDPLAAQNDTQTVDTGAGDSYKEESPADAAIDADDYVCLDIPATDVDWVAGKIIFYVNPGD